MEMKGVCAVPTLLPARHIQAIAGNSWPGEELITAHTSACCARYWVSNGAGTVPNCCCNGASPRRASSFPSGDPASNSSRTPHLQPRDGEAAAVPGSPARRAARDLQRAPRSLATTSPRGAEDRGTRSAARQPGWLEQKIQIPKQVTRAEPRIPLLLEDRHAR